MQTQHEEPTTREVVAEYVYEQARSRDTAARKIAEQTTVGTTWTLMPPWSRLQPSARVAWLARADDLADVVKALPDKALDEMLEIRACQVRRLWVRPA